MSVDKNVPQIRFEGFSSEWEEYPLSTFISSMDAGVSVNSGDRPANESEFGILKTSCVTNGFFEPNENKIVFKTEEIHRLKEPVLENTIIISRMNTPALVGANAYISKTFANYFLPDRLWAAKPSNAGDLKFIAYILGSDKGRLALSELATGTSGSMKNISKPSVLQLKFRAPMDQEQIQIGNIFQKLDSLINQHQQKHDKLCSIKQAMLEKMFPKQGETIPEIRFKGFSGEWKRNKLGECFNERVERCSEGELISVTINSGIKRFSELGRHDNSSDDKSNYKKVEIADIAYNSMRMWQGSSGYSPYSGILSPAYTVIIPKESISPVFFSYLIKKPEVIQVFKNRSQGITSDTWNLKFPVFSEIEIMRPDIEEQTAIGNYFQKLDTLINQHQQQITKLGHIKQACLSKMFV